MEFFSVLYHLFVLVGRGISNYNNLIDSLHLVDFSDLVKEYFVCLISKSSFGLDAGHEIFEVLRVLGEIRLLKYSFHRFYVVVPVDHDFVLEGHIWHPHLNDVFSSRYSIVKDTEHCIEGSPHRPSSVDRNHCSDCVAFYLVVVQPLDCIN